MCTLSKIIDSNICFEKKNRVVGLWPRLSFRRLANHMTISSLTATLLSARWDFRSSPAGKNTPRGETHCMYLKDDPEYKPWHLNWTIHPRHVPLANTFCDYRNIFEVLYDNTNYTCHHRDCTSELRAYEFSTEGIWCLKWYLWDPLLIHESYLNCKKKLKVNH